MSPVYRFSCGHVGRTAMHSNQFIRVAAQRDAELREAHFPCPRLQTYQSDGKR